MSLLTDTDLRTRMCIGQTWEDGSKLHIYPFSESCMTPVGYDLRTGKLYSSSVHGGPFKLEDNGRIGVSRGDTVLIATLEKVDMPKDRSISALIMSRVSMVSKGLSHVATTIDPDWEGNLLIAMTNHSRSTIELQVGQPICTVVFFENKSASTKNCEKLPGRLDIFVNELSSVAQAARKKEFLRLLIPVGIIILLGGVGYMIFRNNPGFVAMTAGGVALAGISQSLTAKR